jgi:hypothetical protein
VVVAVAVSGEVTDTKREVMVISLHLKEVITTLFNRTTVTVSSSLHSNSSRFLVASSSGLLNRFLGTTRISSFRLSRQPPQHQVVFLLLRLPRLMPLLQQHLAAAVSLNGRRSRLLGTTRINNIRLNRQPLQLLVELRLEIQHRPSLQRMRLLLLLQMPELDFQSAYHMKDISIDLILPRELCLRTV